MASITNVWRTFGGYVKKITHHSKITNTPMTFQVFLPSLSEKKQVPALYWLSGLTCNEDNFIHKAGAFKSAEKAGVALICPDTSPRGAGIEGEDEDWDFGTGAGFYVNATEPAWRKHYRMYDYVTKELQEVCEKELPINDARSIFGHSMGGHGALICFLKNPDMYRSVSAFAPICNPTMCDWGKKAFTGYLGSDKQTWKEYDATHLLNTYKGPKSTILIDQGADDNFLTGQLLPENFANVAKEVNHPIKLRMQDGYDHSYFFIASFVEDHIQHHSKALNN